MAEEKTKEASTITGAMVLLRSYSQSPITESVWIKMPPGLNVKVDKSGIYQYIGGKSLEVLKKGYSLSCEVVVVPKTFFIDTVIIRVHKSLEAKLDASSERDKALKRYTNNIAVEAVGVITKGVDGFKPRKDAEASDKGIKSTLRDK